MKITKLAFWLKTVCVCVCVCVWGGGGGGEEANFSGSGGDPPQVPPTKGNLGDKVASCITTLLKSGCKTTILLCIQHIMKENLLLLRDLLEP